MCIKKSNSFVDIHIKDNIEPFSKNIIGKNQLFKETPPFEILDKLFYILTTRHMDTNINYEFSIKILIDKNIILKLEEIIYELKKYYLKCKHEKYLNNLTEKKVITIYRQIFKLYDIKIVSEERYNNNVKYLLYKFIKTTVKNSNLDNFYISNIIEFD